MASAKKKSNSKSRSKRTDAATASHFAVCIENADYLASLELRKLYPVLDDPFAEQHGMIRVIDESGEDYLYPASYFLRVDLPSATERTLRKIA